MLFDADTTANSDRISNGADVDSRSSRAKFAALHATDSIHIVRLIARCRG